MEVANSNKPKGPSVLTRYTALLFMSLMGFGMYIVN